MTIALAGDLKASEVIPVVEKYFGRIPKGAPSEPNRTTEPKQTAERTVILREQSQPIYIEGYHRGAVSDPDSAIYDVIELLMSQGRTSRLYRSLVRDHKIAVQASGGSGLPCTT